MSQPSRWQHFKTVFQHVQAWHNWIFFLRRPLDNSQICFWYQRTDIFDEKLSFINSFNNVRVKNRDAQLQKPSLMSFNISNCFPIGPFWKDEGSKNLLYWQKLPYLKAVLDIFYFAGVPGCYCVLCYCVFAHTAVCLSTQEIDAGKH